jgi:16S rRNA (cytosine1402-N4)-methyltransferase
VKFEQRYKEKDPDRYPGMQDHLKAQGRTPAGTHVPIMIREVLKFLDPRPGDAVADCTVGHGGHAQAFIERIGPSGSLTGLDVDGTQIDRTMARLESLGVPVRLHLRNFAGLEAIAGESGCFDVVFADLGVSSMQIDDPSRGFSYRFDGPLDMRMDLRRPVSAARLLASIDEAELAAMLRDLADEPDAVVVARAIVKRRAARPFERTFDLSSVVLMAKGMTVAEWKQRARTGKAGLHPAARTFQALRIRVNDEMAALDRLLAVAPACLKPGGRIGILSFHSGEDRRVKHAFREGLQSLDYDAIAEDPITATPEEVRANPRSSSAKLRWARKA